jgi:D-3-phosphoglycerate dehydrogenase
MKIIVYDPYLSTEAATVLEAEKVDFDRLLAEADYISLHAPLTAENKRLFGLEQFKKMKPMAYIINTARGGLIDEAALVTAVSEGYIAGAGLDVTDPEPPKPDNPLIHLENVIMTAHTSYYSERSASELARCTVEAVVAALSGQWPLNIANPEVKDRANCRLRV